MKEEGQTSLEKLSNYDYQMLCNYGSRLGLIMRKCVITDLIRLLKWRRRGQNVIHVNMCDM